MTILMRLDCNRQDIDQAELRAFMDWMRDVAGVDTREVAVRATAIEVLDRDPPGQYRLHVTRYVWREPEKVDIVLDPATQEPQLAYETHVITGMTWPFVRAAERRQVRAW